MLAVLLQYQSSLTDSLNMVTSVFGGFMTALGAAQKVFEWLDRVPKLDDTGELKPATCAGKIEFNEVS